jgi:V/A-type H+-transporting ATPase subunit K
LKKTEKNLENKERCVEMVAIENAGAIGIAAAIAIFGGAIGTGIAQASVGSAIMGVVAERPEDTFKLIVYMALPELIVIFGFVVAFLLLGQIGGAEAAAKPA